MIDHFLFQTLTFAQNGARTAVEEFDNSIIRHNKTISDLAISNIETLFLKFGDGDGPNLCRVKSRLVSSTFIENIFRSG